MKFKGPVFPSFLNQSATPKPRRQWIAHCGRSAQRRYLKQAAKKESRMNSNGKPPIPFQAPPAHAVPIVGQAITVVSVYVPVTMTFTCNCGPVEGRVPLTISNGIAVTCPQCRKTYNAFQAAEKVQMPISLPAVEQVPS